MKMLQLISVNTSVVSKLLKFLSLIEDPEDVDRIVETFTEVINVIYLKC